MGNRRRHCFRWIPCLGIGCITGFASPSTAELAPAPPLASAPPGIAYDAPHSSQAALHPGPKPLTWSASWQGWNGLHLELSRRTLLGQWLPGVSQLATWGESPENIPHSEASSPLSPWPEFPGLHLEESRLSARIGGKVAVDAAAFQADDSLPDFEHGIELRRARLFARGDCLLVLPVSYELEVGYIPNEFFIENSYLEFKNLGLLGSLKGGQFQAPMSLVHCGSSRDMMFMEAAPAVQALAPGVEAGIQVGRPVWNSRMTWALGFFADGVGDDFGDATKDFGRVVARVTGLAIDQVNPARPREGQLLHLGLSSYGLYAGNESLRYRSRPASHLAPFVVDTGSIAADGAVTIGLEAAWVQGSLTLQGEYLQAWVESHDGHETGFHGFYTVASWFLTGETRPYNRTQGTFTRVIPRRNFQPDQGGWGAWEIAGRFSHVDLNRAEIHGGRLTLGSFALNWYLHAHFKWRFESNLGRVTGRSPRGDLHVFQTRFEIDF